MRVENWKQKSVQRDQQRDADAKYGDRNQEMKIGEYRFAYSSKSPVPTVGLRQETISSGQERKGQKVFFELQFKSSHNCQATLR
jgi:hypothetical protein